MRNGGTTAVALVLAGLLALVSTDASGGKSKSKKGAADAGYAPARGVRLMAPWGRMGKRYPGQVTDQYGRYVEVKFDDGYSGWCAGDLTNPPVPPLPDPKDKNPFSEGQKVMAVWSLKGKLRAVVLDTYGDLTLVAFESDDRAWVRSHDVQAR